MKPLILQLGLILVVFLALLVILGAQIGAVEFGITTIALVAAISFAVRNHRKKTGA